MIDYHRILTDKIQSIKPSGIRKFFDMVESMENVIALTVGEPDFVTPWHIRQAGIQSLREGKTRYTANAGMTELRREIPEYLSRRFGLEKYDYKNEVIVTVGGSEAIDLCIRAVVNPGDEVIIPEPSFVPYSPLTVLQGGVPVIIDTNEEDEFRITAKQLKEKITPRTKLLILPYPNNPTGAVMHKEHLEEIAEVLRGTNILVLSDEIYAELTYGTRHTSIASIEGMRERTVLVSGFSKAFAMTGWRLGYACGPEPIIAAMTKLHQYAIMCSPTMSQYAGIKAMRDGDSDIEMMAEDYNNRRNLVLAGLKKIGLDCFDPRGAFYVFPSVKRFGISSEEFCSRLLMQEKVAVIPGNAFGASGEGYFRMCYAYSIQKLLEALDRMGRFISTL